MAHSGEGPSKAPNALSPVHPAAKKAPCHFHFRGTASSGACAGIPCPAQVHPKPPLVRLQQPSCDLGLFRAPPTPLDEARRVLGAFR